MEWILYFNRLPLFQCVQFYHFSVLLSLIVLFLWFVSGANSTDIQFWTTIAWWDSTMPRTELRRNKGSWRTLQRSGHVPHKTETTFNPCGRQRVWVGVSLCQRGNHCPHEQIMWLSGRKCSYLFSLFSSFLFIFSLLRGCYLFFLFF